MRRVGSMLSGRQKFLGRHARAFDNEIYVSSAAGCVQASSASLAKDPLRSLLGEDVVAILKLPDDHANLARRAATLLATETVESPAPGSGISQLQNITLLARRAQMQRLHVPTRTSYGTSCVEILSRAVIRLALVDAITAMSSINCLPQGEQYRHT